MTRALPGGSLTSSEFLSRPGAVPTGTAPAGKATAAGVAAHYGNPIVEQHELAAGTAIVDLSHRAVITIEGPDRLSWIHSLTSQSVSHLAPGESTETLLLDMTGRIEYAVRLIDDGTELWLLLEREQASGLLQWLGSMQFALRVELANRSVDFATIGTLGQPELPVAAPHGVPLVWRDPWMNVSQGGHQYAEATRHPAASWTYSELLLPRTKLAGIAASDISVAGLLALEALRIAAWRPSLATEVDDKTIPHELDWLRTAVHLSKGGYRGQQTVAKVHNIGHPPRRLVMLYPDNTDTVLPSHGDDVVAPNRDGQDRTIGRVTSVARHFELGPIALAVIKRGTDPTAELLVRTAGRDIPARQVVIVPPDAGASSSVTVPRLPRLGSVLR
ncbi:folate-binding protein YgfZ [Cryobacterium sp. Hz9]|uniref:CAF17-like 4Fe-4S cluster assembly/insertion protein YgfZ n=1 Tax=Cryobacterium sp. Hz9 TaxID=1259167 RepID=UPI00106C3B9C|nr:glycine cleavage T C-terminal barrel domain-containing protein [Cryobacterium sp. Hz9]TFB66807.1 folate-binding protein [Cryobacterium sp. Hz9]